MIVRYMQSEQWPESPVLLHAINRPVYKDSDCYSKTGKVMKMPLGYLAAKSTGHRMTSSMFSTDSQNFQYGGGNPEIVEQSTAR